MMCGEIEEGCLVRLKSGGPLMVVETIMAIGPRMARCKWFDDDKVMHSSDLRLSVLKKG